MNKPQEGSSNTVDTSPRPRSGVSTSQILAATGVAALLGLGHLGHRGMEKAGFLEHATSSSRGIANIMNQVQVNIDKTCTVALLKEEFRDQSTVIDNGFDIQCKAGKQDPLGPDGRYIVGTGKSNGDNSINFRGFSRGTVFLMNETPSDKLFSLTGVSDAEAAGCETLAGVQECFYESSGYVATEEGGMLRSNKTFDTTFPGGDSTMKDVLAPAKTAYDELFARAKDVATSK